MLLILSIFALGFLHGLGADHLMAISMLSVGRTGNTVRAEAFRIALRFAFGHGILIAVGASIVIILGREIPLFIELGGELVAGFLLISLGAISLFMFLNSYEYRRFDRIDQNTLLTAHSHVPTLIGLLFAVGSLRSFTQLTVFVSIPPGQIWLLTLFGLVLVFVSGILLSMSLFGILLAQILSTRLMMNLRGLSTILTAFASIVLGIYWIRVMEFHP